MKVEIWSDVVCPWCYLGKRRFESALARFAHRDEVEVVWRSFELDPAAPRRREVSAREHLARKYGLDAEQVAASHARLAALGEAEGIELRLDETAGGNTFDAHRLLHLAAEHGRAGELAERLFRAYFTEGEPIGEPETLERLAAELLPAGEVAETLANGRFADEVREDESEALELGVQGVPFFVLGRRYGVSGAQPAELLLGALDRAWAERDAAAG